MTPKMKLVGPLLGFGAFTLCSAADTPRPQGVGPEFAKFYKDPSAFTCISNPSITIPFDRVNDEYCDCPDGSDEPGTSACSYLSPLSPKSPTELGALDKINATIALPGFYCKNKGHAPAYIPFTIVNDGVCDYDVCCDGSDEWSAVGGTKCDNKCAVIGAEARKHAETRQKTLTAAGKKRKELVLEAARLRKQVEDHITDLRTQIEAGEQQVSQLEKEFADIERSERGKVIKGSVGAKAGKLGVLVGLARHRTSELREQLLRVRQDRDSSRERLAELESILSTFKEEYNPNFNDEGVKRAVRSWEDYAARDKSGDADAAHERDLDEISKTDEEAGVHWEEYTSDDSEEAELELLYDFLAYLPGPIRDYLDSSLRTLRITLIENGILADPGQTSGTESRKVTDARTRLDSARSGVNTQRSDLTSKEEDLTKPYGPDDVFRALKGRCVSQDSGEYTYEHCIMDRTTQKSKKGGGSTNMGTFVRIETITVDEDLPADGKGLGSGERIALKYEGGQHCWNGPNRSTMVVLACAAEDEIWKIVEEEKCVYRVEMGTPAVCTAGGKTAEAKAEEGVKDEL